MNLSTEQLATESEFDSQTIRDVDLAAVPLAGKSFYNCDFIGLSAMEASLREVVLEDCRFLRCDLTMATLHGASLRGVHFESCKLMGIDWSPAGGLTFQVSYHECILSHCLFTDLRMKALQITNCKATEASFAGVDLSGADFSGSNLEGARFLDANLEGADLSTAENYAIDPEGNRLKDTKVSVEAALALATRFGVVV